MSANSLGRGGGGGGANPFSAIRIGCDAPFTVRHFLLECGNFAHVRNNCFHVDSMKELFQDIHIDSIMTFLRQINLFNKI